MHPSLDPTIAAHTSAGTVQPPASCGRGHFMRPGARRSRGGHPARPGTRFRSPTASNAPGCTEMSPTASTVPDVADGFSLIRKLSAPDLTSQGTSDLLRRRGQPPWCRRIPRSGGHNRRRGGVSSLQFSTAAHGNHGRSCTCTPVPKARTCAPPSENRETRHQRQQSSSVTSGSSHGSPQNFHRIRHHKRT